MYNNSFCGKLNYIVCQITCLGYVWEQLMDAFSTIVSCKIKTTHNKLTLYNISFCKKKPQYPLTCCFGVKTTFRLSNNYEQLAYVV